MDVEEPSEVVYLPACTDDLKPFIGKKFNTLEEAISFYESYARNAGFDTRKFGSKRDAGLIKWCYVVCSREGQKRFDDRDAINAREGFVNKRRRSSKRCECNARISLKYESKNGMGGYIITQFIEAHNHAMVDERHRRFMSLNRSIDDLHQKFITDCVKANIGPTHAFKLLNEMLGGYDGVGCTVMEVRNYARDMKAYIEGTDAQMVLNEMHRKKETCGGFSFAFEVDGEDKLKRLFWCDGVSKRNFHMFGDVVSFDTTYYTNKYCMIFAPFTGKNNHGRPVTFAAGLVSNEDADSFSWLFNQFVNCMGASPRLLITDQDLGMKAAVERVLINTRHRWCMWHIMLKISDKIPKALLSNENFKNDLNACVWSDLIEPNEFEASWHGIMERYDLVNETWFKNMYLHRQFWVPAFFRDFPMGSVLKTTSVSESENSFFKRYSKPRSNLVEFMMNFNHALDQQRNENARLDYLDSTIVPILGTELSIEKHASTIYTDNMFKNVQAEIVEACFKCRVVEMLIESRMEKYKVMDNSRKTWTVSYDTGNDIYHCGCKLFVRFGILCSHIIFVLKNKDVKLIPEKYYGSRWLKTSLARAVHGLSSNVIEDHTLLDEKRKAMNKLYASFFGLVHKVEGNIDHIHSLISALDDAGVQMFGEGVLSSIIEKKKMIEEFYGSARPVAIEIHPPNVVKTKGSGSRLISRKEKAVRELNKPVRRCAKCGELGHHDARNCDKVKERNKVNSKNQQ